MNRTEKEQVVSELKNTLESSETVVVVKQSGLTVAESTQLRSKCRELDAGFKVYKNRLVKIAIAGTRFEHLADSLNGTTALAYSQDPIAASKAVYTFAKTNDKLVLVAGGMGDKVLSADDIKQWGALPGLDELRGKIVGLLQAPGGQIARVLNAYSEAGGASVSGDDTTVEETKTEEVSSDDTQKSE
ncbi:MAG: 50S ribosomal protein L10 [Alphaproteobacteria bacterium]|nr:50S ribosomal protein L10 [Alphaproteobacteria bacterium]